MTRSLRRFTWAARIVAPLRLALPFIAAILTALVLVGCKDKPPKSEPISTAAVAAPVGLLADVFLTTPDVTWQRMRGKVGGPAALLPANFPSLVVTLLGLPPQVAEQVDGNLASYGAMVETAPGGAYDLVLAVHLRDETRVIEVLTGGQDPRFISKKDSSGVLLIEPKVKSSDQFASMGIANHYLIASKTAAALIMAGAYVTRTLPTLPKPSSEISVMAGHQALAGPIAARIRSEWFAFKKAREQDDLALREQHGGRAPDFGDPTAALTDIDGKIRRLTEIMTDLSQARLEVNTDDLGVHSRLAMVPQAATGVASREIGALVVGDTAPLLDLPASSLVALLTRDSEEVRKAGAQEQVEGLANVLGERMNPDDKKRVGEVLDAWALGRGDWIVAGVQWSGESRALLVRGALKDGAAFDKGVEGLFALPSVSGLKDPIERFAGKLAFSKVAVEGNARTVHVQREPATNAGPDGKKAQGKGQVVVKRRKGADSGEFDVNWEIDPTGLLFRLVATPDAKGWLSAQSKAKQPTLGEDPEIANVVRALGNESAFVFLFQPFKLMAGLGPRGGAQTPASSPVVFSYGRSKADGWFRLELPYGAVTELARALMAR